MTRIRILTTGAIVLFASGALAVAAHAQTAPGDAPGQPLQLLQLLHLAPPPEQAEKTRPRPPVAATRKPIHTRVAQHKRPQTPPPAATTAALAATPDGIWPAANAVAVPADSAAAAAATPFGAPPPELDPGQLVVDGQTIRLVAADDVNEIDLAAADAAPPSATATPDTASANTAATSDVADPAPKSDSLAAATSAEPQAGEVGSATWIAQVLAAIGGAVTAGSLAWFLIGAAPQRTYT